MINMLEWVVPLMVVGTLILDWTTSESDFAPSIIQYICIVIGIINVLIPSDKINEALFPIEEIDEVGVFSESEKKFESSYSGNNPMMYNKSNL